MNCILVLFSYHHNNTEKIAKVFARVLDAQIRRPRETSPEEIQEYSLVGFGSGIYGEKHHRTLLDLADRLPQVTEKKAFIFSTSAIMGEDKVAKDHSTLREKLVSKGYAIVDEFACKGFCDWGPFKLFGGRSKGHPSKEEFKKAEEFAKSLKKKN